MTDKNGIITHIEELLGSNGSRAYAEAMFPLLQQAGYITFDAGAGFSMEPVPDDDDTWTSMLCTACETVDLAEAKARYPEHEIRAFIETADDSDAIPRDELLGMFRSIYERDPDSEDERVGLWDLICAGVATEE